MAANSTQLHEQILLTNKLKEILVLSINKLSKYEDLGRLDKALVIIGYLTKILNIIRYWYYSNLPYSKLPECIEKTLECSLDDIKEKLKILPRELYIDLTTLLFNMYSQEEGLGSLEMIGLTKDNNFVDLQNVI